jgi:hypothetical protein
VTIHERISVIYSDLPADWSNDLKRSEVIDYLEDLKRFAQAVLWKEETVLVIAYPVLHVESTSNLINAESLTP